MSCAEARGYGISANCGPSGQYWEPRTGAEPKLSGEVGFGSALSWSDNVEDAFAGDEDGLFEWTSISPRMSALSFEIWVCDIKPIVAVTAHQFMSRDELNQLYRWMQLNAAALEAAQSGAIDTAELVARLQKLPPS